MIRLARYVWGGGGDWCRRCEKNGERCAAGLPGENGRLCPQVEHAPRTELEQTAWTIAGAPGVWRTEWREEKTPAGEWRRRRFAMGLSMSEALVRADPADDATRAALVSLFSSIEQGRIVGEEKGMEGESDG